MRIALINDTHAGARGDSLLFNEFFFKFWENVFFPYLKKHSIKHIVHLGDVVDRRKFINYVILNQWRKRFFDVLVRENITMDVIVGNHDVTYKNTNEINAIHELFNHYDNINVYISPLEKNYDDLAIALVPWINSSNYEQSMIFLEETKSQIVFGHFEISGFEMDRGNICHTGIQRNVFDKFDMVLSGHFHHKSNDGTVYYLGNQYEITWADCDDKRGFHVFDTQNRDLTFIENPYKMFHKIYYDDNEQDIDHWKKFDYSKYKDSYVKIVVCNKKNSFLFDTVINDLYKIGVADLSIVEDVMEIESHDEELIDRAEDTMTILSKYIDNSTLGVDSNKLKNLMRELYVESLTIETTE